MTKTILLATLAALLAAPAFANTSRTTPKAQQGQIGDLQHSPKVLWDVFVNGKYVGSDPDAAIRNQLILHFGAAE